MKSNQMVFEVEGKRYELTVKSRISIAEERYLVEQCADAFFDANGNYDPGYGEIVKGVLLFVAYTDVWEREFGKEDESEAPKMTGERLNRLCEIMDAMIDTMYESNDLDTYNGDYTWRAQYRRIATSIRSKVSARLGEHPFKHTAEILNALLQSVSASFETAQLESSKYVQEMIEKAGGLEGLYKKIRGNDGVQQNEPAKIVAMPNANTEQKE